MQEADKDFSSVSLIKSKKRVADHGEVFTPSWLVEAMLDLTEESDRIDARYLEQACGTGNFLIEILRRKLAIVELKSRKAGLDKSRFALIAIMSLYGIELLEDNIQECRKRLLEVFADYLNVGKSNEFYKAASRVLSLNLIHGDALKMRTDCNRPIIFSEWSYSGKGKFLRRDFPFDLLTQTAIEKRADLAPTAVHGPLSVNEIAYPSRTEPKRKQL